MRRLAWFACLVLGLVACACPGGGAGPGTGAGPNGGGGGATGDCAAARTHAEQLYRAAASSADDPTVADNAAMVAADCAADPARVARCAAAATTVAQLESDCLVPLDDEGSEGLRFTR